MAKSLKSKENSSSDVVLGSEGENAAKEGRRGTPGHSSAESDVIEDLSSSFERHEATTR